MLHDHYEHSQVVFAMIVLVGVIVDNLILIIHHYYSADAVVAYHCIHLGQLVSDLFLHKSKNIKEC